MAATFLSVFVTIYINLQSIDLWHLLVCYIIHFNSVNVNYVLPSAPRRVIRYTLHHAIHPYA